MNLQCVQLEPVKVSRTVSTIKLGYGTRNTAPCLHEVAEAPLQEGRRRTIERPMNECEQETDNLITIGITIALWSNYCKVS